MDLKTIEVVGKFEERNVIVVQEQKVGSQTPTCLLSCKINVNISEFLRSRKRPTKATNGQNSRRYLNSLSEHLYADIPCTSAYFT